MKVSKIIYKKKLPGQLAKGADFKNCILIFDQILLEKYSDWISKFPRQLAVQAGEGLKELSDFPTQMEAILKLTEGISREKLSIVSFGGGSVGDFSGFVASILKRGVSLIHVPSTWLSAMDSAHGGKTALNIGAIKNQIGTFYPADIIYLVKDVLHSQPQARIEEAAGEYYKMALIAGGDLWRSCLKSKGLSAAPLWRDLSKVIAAKVKIVKQDPYEAKGLRHVLNLGHTVGHVLESQLGIPHGIAVHMGIRFSIEWGIQKKISKASIIPDGLLPSKEVLKKHLQQVSEPQAILNQDKKTAGANELRFIFLKKPGQPIIKKVKIAALAKEWERQKWD